MVRRIGSVLLLAGLLFSVAACTNKHVNNPIADVNSVQPDKVLFDRAMDAMKHNKFDVSRLTLQTLINAYPDSEYIARAKLAIGDSWYAEGTSSALAQAEAEYKDFITFFPNMEAEASEAQMKIADIHYRQMEKPDRDYTHARRAEEEYRAMITQYPDSPLVPRATQRLREVQEVLAEREFRIGRFYYLRQSWAASIARLQSLTDTYPLYSAADEALFMLGTAYEKQYSAIRQAKGLKEDVRERLASQFADKAAAAFDRIVTRYPVMPRAEEAKQRLAALGRPVPQPTAEAIAQNRAEEESRLETGRLGQLMSVFTKHPDIAEASRVGEPTLVDPKQTGAPEVVKSTNEAIVRAAVAGSGPTQNVSVDTTVGKDGAPPPNQPTPRSDAPATSAAPAPTTPPADSAAPDKAGGDTGIPELKPIPDASTAKPGDPAAQTQAPPPAPSQVNELATGPAAKTADAAKSSGKSANANDKDKEKDSSSSKKKKKRKLLPF